MATSSNTPSREPSLDPEDELDRIMRESSPPLDNTDGPPSSDGLDGASDMDATSSNAAGTGGAVRNELILARRLASQYKLHPYQRDQLDELVKGPPLMRDMFIFVKSCSIENKLDGIITAAPAYEMSEALNTNIKSLVVAVLLSPKLNAYKGEIPKDSVLKLLLRDQLHVPANYHTDSFVSKTIIEAIKEALTQTRSNFKKRIALSIKNKETLYDMAMALIAGTKCTVTPSLQGKLALLRKILAECKDLKDPKFWDKVDAHLHAIRTKAAGNDDKILKVLKAYVLADVKKYGTKANSEALVSQEPNAWEQSIGQVLQEQV